MNRQEIIRKSLKAGIIVFAATGFQYLFAFGTQVVLARILDPSHFGALAFAAMVAMFFNNFTNIHGDKFIIKEKDGIQKKLNNTFTLELILSIVLIFLVVCLAPLLMQLLGKPELTKFVQLLACVFLYNPLSKPRSLFERELSFFRAKFPMVIGQLIGGIVGIILAYLGYGVWSLIWWRITTFASEALIIWCIIPYKPRLAWNGAILRGIVSFGLPLLGSSLLVFFYWNIDYYIVGKLLGEEQLGYYWLAFQVSHYFLKAKTAVISVVFPAFSRMGNEDDIKKGFEILTRLTAIIYMFPTIIVLVLGESLIKFIFGSKWLPATTALQIFMVLTTLKAVTSYWDPIIMYANKTKILFYMTIYGVLATSIFAYLGTKLAGITGTAIGVLLAHFIGTLIMIMILRRFFVLKYDYLINIAAYYITSLIMLKLIVNVIGSNTWLLCVMILIYSLTTICFFQNIFKSYLRSYIQNKKRESIT